MNHLVLFKNAIANVLRGSTAALIAVLLPPFLTRSLPIETYGIWSLVLQLSAYVGYLDFGIQTAIGRFVAQTTELKNYEQRNQIVSTSLAILTISALLGTLLILVLSWQLPNLFHEMPIALRSTAQLLLLVIGVSQAVGLPFSTFTGIFIGLQRNELPAIIISSGRAIGAILVIAIAWRSGNILYMGIAFALTNLVFYIIQLVVCKFLVKDIEISRKLVSKYAGKEILKYCFSLSIWTFATLLIVGLDTAIVGFYDFTSVAHYAIAASLITFILGIQNAIFTVLIPAAAVLEARENAKELGELLITTTRYSMFLLLLSGLPLIILATNILSLWVGPEYVDKTVVLLQILIIANIVRLSVLPYAMLLIGTGQQRLVIISPLIEGISNLLASIIGASLIGAKGVAFGTLFSSLIGFALNLFYNMPRTKGIEVNRLLYVKKGILTPLLCVTPLIGISLLILLYANLSSLSLVSLMVGGSLATILLIWQWGLESKERLMLSSIITSKQFLTKKTL